MKTLMKSIVAFVLLISIGTEAQAARRDNRQARQHARIHEGVKSGELTTGEAMKLRKQQRHIRRMENRAEADGTVTNREKYRIEKAQDRASKNIYRKKHNDAERGNGDGTVPPTGSTENAAAASPDSQ